MNTPHETEQSPWTPLKVFVFISGACLLFFGGLTLLDLVNGRMSLPLIEGMTFSTLVMTSIFIVGVNGLILVIEAVNIGWEKSAFKRILFLETETARSDFFYFLLRISGLVYVFSFILSFGLCYVAALQLGRYLNFDMLVTLPIYFQFPIIVLVNSFMFYWSHRLMHTHQLFEIHKVHHSALEMNVLTPTRNHPIDFMIMIVINTVPAAILGADSLAVMAYLGLNGLYQCAVHSSITFMDAKWIRFLIISPKAHRVHHSCEKEHFDKNFGILTLWDVLFGTYYNPTKAHDFDLGVHNTEDFNTDHPWKELIMVMKRWLAPIK
jgi:sterol desaturase/sphingolipid hydroxylase (fatty acid hydroxylase superfamily)